VNSHGRDDFQPKMSPVTIEQKTRTSLCGRHGDHVPTITSGPWKCSSGWIYELLRAKCSRIVANMEKRRRNCRCSVEKSVATDGDEGGSAALPRFLD